MKRPDTGVYNKDDLATYKRILEATNAHKRYYLPTTRRNVNRGPKYTKIIGPLFRTTRTGRGGGHVYKYIQTGNDLYMEVRRRGNDIIDYVHWDYPYKLVDRLRLLIESQRAGNSGHTNEIVSVVEELREPDIVV